MEHAPPGLSEASRGTSWSAVSSDVDRNGAYAVESTTDVLLLLLFNKDTVENDVRVMLSQSVSGTAEVYRVTES